MDFGNALPTLMPDMSTGLHDQLTQSDFNSVAQSTSLPRSLASLDQAMTSGKDESYSDLLSRFTKDEMTPGQQMLALFEFSRLNTHVLEVTNLANSLKGACDKLQQNG